MIPAQVKDKLGACKRQRDFPNIDMQETEHDHDDETCQQQDASKTCADRISKDFSDIQLLQIQ